MQANKVPVQNSLKSGKWLNSTCKMCLHSCGIRVHVTDDGIVNKVEGNPTNPANSGRMCTKGNAAILRHYDLNRFKTPLKRSNPEKGPGVDPKWLPISWLRNRGPRVEKNVARRSAPPVAVDQQLPEDIPLGVACLSAAMPTFFPRSGISAAAATIR